MANKKIWFTKTARFCLFDKTSFNSNSFKTVRGVDYNYFIFKNRRAIYPHNFFPVTSSGSGGHLEERAGYGRRLFKGSKTKSPAVRMRVFRILRDSAVTIILSRSDRKRPPRTAGSGDLPRNDFSDGGRHRLCTKVPGKFVILATVCQIYARNSWSFARSRLIIDRWIIARFKTYPEMIRRRRGPTVWRTTPGARPFVSKFVRYFFSLHFYFLLAPTAVFPLVAPSRTDATRPPDPLGADRYPRCSLPLWLDSRERLESCPEVFVRSKDRKESGSSDQYLL